MAETKRQMSASGISMIHQIQRTRLQAGGCKAWPESWNELQSNRSFTWKGGVLDLPTSFVTSKKERKNNHKVQFYGRSCST